MLDEPTYRAWWSLHRRVARGESLSATEQVAYDAGRTQLHQAEKLDSGAGQLRQARAAARTLAAEHTQLHARQQLLDNEIAALEAVLDEATNEKLALKD